MGDVPFLIVHGAWVWKAALVVVALGAGGGLVAWQRWRARYEARVMAEGLDIGGDRSVRGRLGGSGDGALVAALHAEPREGVPFTGYWRARELWIDTAGGRLALEGRVHVLAGSRAAAAEHGVPAEFSDEALRESAEHAPWLRRRGAAVRSASALTLSAGDEVIVCADRLERGPAAGPADYREGPGEWKLRGSPQAPIRIAARTPSGRAQPVSYRSIAFALLLVLPATYMLGFVLGGRLEDACAEERGTELSSFDRCSLAAALPHQIDDVRVHLHRRLRNLPIRDGADFGVRRWLAERVAGERLAANLLLDHERYEEGARAVRGHDPASERLALALTGRFEAAAAIDVRDELSVPLFIAAGRWADAATALEASAKDPARAPWRRHNLNPCVLELLRHHAGDPGALDRLRAARRENPERMCNAVALAILPTDERAAILARWRDGGTAISQDELAAFVWQYGVATDGLSTLEPIVAALVETPSTDLAWLVGASPAPFADTLTPQQRVALAEWRAMAQWLDGDAAAASRTLAAARGDARTVERGDAYLVRLASFLAATAPRPTHDDFELMIRALRLSTRELGEPSTALETLRTSGNGEPLAAVLERHHGLDNIVRLVWPAIERGRDAVAMRLIWRDAPLAQAAARLRRPWDWATRAAMRRTLFAAIGIPDEAARWAAIYERFDAMLADRAKLTALILTTW